MIIVECEQGSEDWHAVRLGIPTASEFSRIVTKTGRLSTQRDDYIAELCVEYVYGEPYREFQGNYWTERGIDLEAEAMAYYELDRAQRGERVGFVFRDEQRDVGCSPDFLVGDDGLCEMKCPAPKTHLKWLLKPEPPTDHAQQLQGQLWVTGRQWVDWLSYCPGLPPVLHRIYPDFALQHALDEHMPAFLDELANGKAFLRSLGYEAA